MNLRRVAALAALTLMVSGCAAIPTVGVVPAASATAAAPAEPPARMCGNTAPGPATAPAGAVAVNPVVDGDLAAKTDANPAGTTFWLAPGVHTLGTSEFGQVIPRAGNTYLGAPGAVLDGRGMNRYAFTQQATGVTIRHLTVQGFVAPSGEGVVNHDSGNDWVIEHNTIQGNDGAGMMAGARQVVRGNCIRDNGQYAMNAYQAAAGIVGLLVEGNEMSGNNTDDWEARIPGCGCSGNVKFWATTGTTVRGNWVHNNRGVGLWADNNNLDLLIEGNLIEGNDDEALFVEQNYNTLIRDNTIRNNTWVKGRAFAARNDNFPVAAIYISEAGGEPRLPARPETSGRMEISGNVMVNNWSGVTLWENADRFCNSPANTGSDCTLLVGARNVSTCSQPGIGSEPLYSDCRWKSKNALITGNTMIYDPAVVPGSRAGFSGRQSVISNFGTYPDWSPYMGTVIQQAITFEQNNIWRANSYSGPWMFMPFDTGRLIDRAAWQAAPYNQDVGSTFDGTPPATTTPPPTTTTPPTTVPPTTTTTVELPPTTEPPAPASPVEDAIGGDSALTDGEKAALVAVYRCLVRDC